MSSMYADLGVKYNLAMEAIGAITEKNQLLLDTNSELKSKLDQIAQNWESTGIDREEYYVELTKQVENLKILSSSLGRLKKTVIRYLEDVKAASSSGM